MSTVDVICVLISLVEGLDREKGDVVSFYGIMYYGREIFQINIRKYPKYK